jgi:hypothetical protein
MVCKPYQYSAPEGFKYFIACGQVVLVLMLSLGVYNWFLESLRLSQTSKKWAMFYVFLGFWDFVSDVTMLALIEPYNPYGLFWVSLGAISLSIVASVLLAYFSKITDASWPVRVIIFIASCGNLFDEPPSGSIQLCLSWSPGMWNHITILVVEQAPQLGVQCLLLYLQGIQGFSSLDWAIWCQSATFTLVNALKNVQQIFLARKTTKAEAGANGVDLNMEFIGQATTVAGACGCLSFCATS